MNGMAICGYLWLVFVVVWMIWAFRNKPVQSRESVSSRLTYSVLTMAGFFAMFSNDITRSWLRFRVFPNTLLIQTLAVLITATGIGIAFWARAYLGGNWSGAVTVKVGHQLVRSGPYGFVRHPIYTGLMLALVGTALARGQVRGLVGVMLAYAGFRMKSLIEERVMMNTFGAQYEAYKRSTGAIVPGLPL